MTQDSSPPRHWILSGTPENWVLGVNDGIWGARENLKSHWDRMSKGDYLFFYGTAPVKGLIGFGRLQSKFRQDKPLWPDEVRTKTVIWPLRFEINIKYVVPRENWDIDKVETPFAARGGITPIVREDLIKEIWTRIEAEWGPEQKPDFEPAEAVQEATKLADKGSLHDAIKELIYRLGTLDHYFCEKEHRMDSQRLDVVWKKLEQSVPNYVFEIQVGGDPVQALQKLKHAWDLWNSNIFIVIDQAQIPKLNELLSGSFHEIREHINIVTLEKIQRLYEARSQLEELKKGLGLP